MGLCRSRGVALATDLVLGASGTTGARVHLRIYPRGEAVLFFADKPVATGWHRICSNGAAG